MTEEFVKYPRANHSLTAGLQLSVYVSVSARLPTTWGQRLCMLGGCIGYSRQSIHVGWIERVNIRPKYDHDHESTNVLWFYLVCDMYICMVCVHVGEWGHMCVAHSKSVEVRGPSSMWLLTFYLVWDRASLLFVYHCVWQGFSYLFLSCCRSTGMEVWAMGLRQEYWDRGRSIGVEVGALDGGQNIGMEVEILWWR